MSFTWTNSYWETPPRTVLRAGSQKFSLINDNVNKRGGGKDAAMCLTSLLASASSVKHRSKT